METFYQGTPEFYEELLILFGALEEDEEEDED